MGLMMKTPPLAVHGAAVYPFSEALRDRYILDSAFGGDGKEDDGTFELGMRHGDEYWLPRGCAGQGPTQDLQEDGEHYAYKVTFEPQHDDQARVVAEMLMHLDEGTSHIVQAPTGYGKTYLGAVAIGHLQKSALILTTKEDLMPQWREALRNVLGLTDDQIAYWRGDKTPPPEAPVVVALVQSVLKGPVRYPEWMFKGYGLVISDEVHRMGADTFTSAMWWLPARLRLGLSATPKRSDGKDVVFHNHIGPVLVVGQQETLVPKVIMEHMPWKCPRRAKKNKKTGKVMIARIPHKAGRITHMLPFIANDRATSIKIAKFMRLAYIRGRCNVVFADTMQHLHALHDIAIEYGVKPADIGWYVGLTADVYKHLPAKQRSDFRDGQAKKKLIFATYKMCSEGTNKPWWDTATLAGPRGDINQIAGRIRRHWEGKQDPLLYIPVYRDSPVFSSYANNAIKWLKSIGAVVKVYRPN